MTEIPGREYAVEGLMHDGELEVLALFDKPDPLDGPFFEETIYVTPSSAPAEEQAAICTGIRAAAAAIGLQHGPVHAECRVNADGVFVLETGVPWDRPRTGSYVDVIKLGLEEVRLSAYQYDAMTQILDTNHMRLTTSGIQMSPISLRLVYPGELDLMARIAGLQLLHRWGGWRREPFTVDSRRHVSVYGRRAA